VLELEVLDAVRRGVAAAAERLLRSADAVGQADVYASFSTVALEHDYTCPQLDEGDEIAIEGGRHPVVEVAQREIAFVPNDTLLDAQCRLVVLTGPNMAGKSTYLRQIGLIVLLAQVGSFVPARAARIGLVDRIFTRVGAQDDLAAGQSTFMVEMSETSAILAACTPRSLVILDEIGRGTSTYDGLAIAQAVLEYLHDDPAHRAKTVFATHYHELTALAESRPHVVNFRMEVLEEGDRVVFLRRVVPGGADKSYGIHVAELAGLPPAVTRRARGLLRAYEGNGQATRAARRRIREAASALQLSLFGESSAAPDEAPVAGAG
jgi:DNA mismatch repair protein MutS